MVKLRPFQIKGVRQILKWRGRALLADEQGLGKTISSLYWIHKIKERRPVVIVTPASMKYTWQHEALTHFNMRCEVLEGRRKKQNKLPGPITILNYDILASWLPVILDAKIQCLIGDEIHYIKSLKAQRTKAFLAAAKDVPSVIGLSGTPMTKRPVELWPTLFAIRPELFPKFQPYAWRYCQPKYTPWGWQFKGATNRDELHRILRANVMIRRLKKEVAPELPDKVRKTIHLHFSKKGYDEYNRARWDFIQWLRTFNPAKADRAKRSQALTKIGYMLRLVAQLKLEFSTAWIQDFFEENPNEKIVMMTMHRNVIDHFHEKFPGSVIIDGRVSGLKRTDTIRKFQTNPKTKLLLGNWKAAGVGITLTASANLVAHDFPWTPGDLWQGEDRIHRIGQNRTCFIYYLLAVGTIEEKLLAMLQESSMDMSEILDGVKQKEKEMDLFNTLIKEAGKK